MPEIPLGSRYLVQNPEWGELYFKYLHWSAWETGVGKLRYRHGLSKGKWAFIRRTAIASGRHSKQKSWKGAGTSQPVLFRPEARWLMLIATLHYLGRSLLCPALNRTIQSLPWRITTQPRETACSDTLLNKLQMHKRETRWNLRKQHLKYSKSIMTNWPNLWPKKNHFSYKDN